MTASPRVVEDGQPVPKGGGRELVGKPYQIAGRTYVPRESSGYSRVGLASWYGAAFHGRLTANGEVFDRHSVAAAHTTMPLPSYARVTNLENNRSMIVRVNDRGPYHANRVLDVSERVAEALDFKRRGTAKVKVDYVARASTRGSDDTKLLATLRLDGQPALYPGQSAPVMVAEARPAAVPVAPAALAFRTAAAPDEVAEDQAPEPAAAPRRAPAVVAQETSPQHLANVPLPPERPYDLGTIPNAATPVRPQRTPVAQVGGRATYAGMFYAAPEGRGVRLSKDDPFRQLRPQPTVQFRSAL
ncbi:MAG TPA: septal ring lytic transglycosylase RlpA family protein [Beijerinckiaceae bacterium]